MSDIEISDKSPRKKIKPGLIFKRLLPQGGTELIRISENAEYRVSCSDINDFPDSFNDAIRNIMRNDSDPNIASHSHINIGKEFGKTFRIYVFLNSQVIIIESLFEILDNPDGYGHEDFLLQNYIFPCYRQTKYVRWANSDLFYLMFHSGLAKRIYTYIKSKDSVSSNPFQKIDLSESPCVAKIYPSDGPLIQKYISIPKTINTNKGDYSIMEFNGSEYLKMDHKEYHKNAAAPGTALSNYDEWRMAIDEIVSKMKEIKL